MLFPADTGTHPDQQGAEPQVGLPHAVIVAVTRDALRDAVQEGVRAAGIGPERTADVRRTHDLLQQLIDVLGQTLEEVRELRADTYTVTSTIARQR